MANHTQMSKSQAAPFQVRDCTLLSMATGLRAQNLREFRNGLLEAPAASIYHHFWGRFLRSQMEDPEYNNDFASWAQHGLHQKALAERLSAVNPAFYPDLKSLKDTLLDIVEGYLDESEVVHWVQADSIFQFIRSQIIVFDMNMKLQSPIDMAERIGSFVPGTIYYHFIDARRRTPDHQDDFSRWVSGFGERWEPLVHAMRAIDPYFSTLAELRYQLAQTFKQHVQEVHR